MTELLLLFPLAACLVLFFVKSKFLNVFFLNLYALLHISVTACYFFKPEVANILPGLKYFSVDGLNLIFLAVLSVVFAASTVYNNGYIANKNFDAKTSTKYISAILLFVFSMSGAILSSNLAVAWVFVEATTLASGYLIYFKKTKHSLEAAWKYIFICSIGIALAFVGIILLSTAAGDYNSLEYVDLYNNARFFSPFWLKIAFVFILFGIGTKTGLAPMHFWLPDAHAQAPSPVSALLSASLLNCAYLIIVRVYKVLILAGCAEQAKIMLLLTGFLSVFVAAVFLYSSKNYKRMLAYSSIENMGILAIGTAMGGFAMYAAILHMIGHSLVKASFFLTSGNILTMFRSKKVKSACGVMRVESRTAWLFTACCFAIVATPPSLLFISEFLLLKQMFIDKQYVLAILLLILLTIVIFGITTTVFKIVFSEGQKSGLETAVANKSKIRPCMIVPQVVLLLIVFVLGLFIPERLNDLINIGVGGL